MKNIVIIGALGLALLYVSAVAVAQVAAPAQPPPEGLAKFVWDGRE
jgi:hypothetical protein